MTVYMEVSFAGIRSREGSKISRKRVKEVMTFALEKLAEDNGFSFRLHRIESPSERIVQDADD